MSKPLETIEYAPYRGECEPVTDAQIAKISTHKGHLEIKCYYEFQELLESETLEGKYRENFVKCHLILRRDGIEICRSVRVHPEDKRQEECPILEIWSKTGLRFNVVAKNDELDRVMRVLRDWILS